MCIHYSLIGDQYDPIFLLQEYFMTIQYSVVFYYFVSQLCDTFKILTQLYRIKIPLIVINGIMLIGFAIFVGIYTWLNKGLYNCNNAIWIYLHGCNIVLSISFTIIGIKASKLLKILSNDKNLIIDNDKIKQFW